MDTGLSGKNILITGASGGIGRATALAFASEQARLVLHFNRNQSSVETLSQAIASPTLPLQADLSVEQQVDALFKKSIEHYSAIDGIVVNAGIWKPLPMPVERMQLSQWRETIEYNLTSAFLTCRAFLRHLADQPRERASIVLIGSTAALVGEEGHADYAASKAALTYGLLHSLKNEIVRLAPKGRVNCVCPGWVDTPMSQTYTQDDGAVRNACSTIALNKIATAEDIAGTIVFLSSDALAGHISGAIMPIHGGMEGRLLHRTS